MNRFLFTFLVVLAVSSSTTVLGQRPSQEELELETLYIEATRAKLLGDYEKAIELFKKILEEDDANDVVLFELSKVYLAAEAPKDALVQIKKAVELSPDNIWYQEELAAIHAANQDFIAAAEVYNNLVKKEPNEQKFYYDLAFYYVKNNSLKKAIEVLNKHETKFGVTEEVIGRKFNLYRTLDNVSKAEQELLKLSKAFPTMTSYALGLAKFYEDTNNLSKAKSTYARILKIDPELLEAQVALNRLEKGKSNTNQDVDWANPSLNIDLKISRLIGSIKGLEKASQEKQDEVIQISQSIVQAHPSDAKAFAIQGDVFNFSGRSHEAIEAYEESLELEKNVFSVWSQLLRLYHDTYRMEALMSYSEKALDYFPNEATIYYWNGLAANKLSMFNEAYSTLVQADIMSKSDKVFNNDVKLQLAVALLGLGKTDKSLATFEAIDMSASNSANFLLESAFYQLKQGKTSAVENTIKMLQRSNAGQWQLLALRGQLAYAQEQYEEAKNMFDQSAKSAPGTAFSLFEKIGDTLFQLGDIEGAVKSWKKSKEAGNLSTSISKKIASRQI